MMFSPTHCKLIPMNAVRQLETPDELVNEFERLNEEGQRLLTFYAGPGRSPLETSLTMILIGAAGTLSVLRSHIPLNGRFRSFVPEWPIFHVFEREIFEQTGIVPEGNPWLKPVRFPENSPVKMEQYPFFSVEGKEVHEVGVGPVHAGVIEPGHFRFMCSGETVNHLEIQLGYQHRGVEELLRKRDPRRVSTLIESVAGDSSVTHVTAYSLALESLGEQVVEVETKSVREIAIELERIAMHLAGLAGIAGDIAYLPGASTYGRLRTAVINATMRLSGSRFGRCWIRPGGILHGISGEQTKDLSAVLAGVKADIQVINDCMFTSKSVGHRLKDTGVVTYQLAKEIGLVGMIARSSGVQIDLRGLTHSNDESTDLIKVGERYRGDCMARALIRRDEILESIEWIRNILQEGKKFPANMKPIENFSPECLVVSGVEGWRGEVIHCIETDKNGKILNYRVQDPSLRNWFGLALAMRSNAISDFPICNKSFDLSYCGNDL